MSRTDVAALLRARNRLVPPDRRRRGLEREGGLSLLLHALVIATLLLTVTRKQLNDANETSPIAVVFEGGPKASTPQTQESRRSSPATAPDVNATETVPPGAAAPSRPSPPAQQRQQQQQQAEPQAAPPTPAAPGGIQAQDVPAAPAGVAPLQLPPPAVVARHGSTPRPVQHPGAARAAASASPFAALSAPMSLSLAGRPPPPASQGHLQRGINLTMAPTDQNRNVMTRYAEARRKLGEDWWAAFSNFVEQHKYYPLAAADRGEDGQSVLHLVIARDGTVESVRVELSSGSPELDMAWISIFRNAKVPPFPSGTEENEISFPASMTYILEHM